jgi:hypothetical protein
MINAIASLFKGKNRQKMKLSKEEKMIKYVVQTKNDYDTFMLEHGIYIEKIVKKGKEIAKKRFEGAYVDVLIENLEVLEREINGMSRASERCAKLPKVFDELDQAYKGEALARLVSSADMIRYRANGAGSILEDVTKALAMNEECFDLAKKCQEHVVPWLKQFHKEIPN